MTALARTANVPSVDPQLLKVLHATVQGFATDLGTQVSAVIAQQLKRQVASKTIGKKISDVMPALVEQAFIAGFLQDQESARHRRALLAHLLTAAELQRSSGVALTLPVDAAVGEADELTSEAAAKLLHVSRTHLNTLVDTGQLGEVRRTAGGHRRIARTAVLQYKAASKVRQTRGLDAMAEASARLGLYDQELAGVPVRAKR